MGSTTSNPNITIQLLPGAEVDAFEDRKDVIFGQTGANATDAPLTGTLNTNVHLLTTAELGAKFGADSFLINMIQEWKATNEGKSPLDVVAVDAGAGTAADCVITVTAGATNPTADASFYLSLVDDSYKVEIACVVADTVTTIGDKMKAAVNALTDAVFTGDNTAGVFTATARDVGTIGNNYGVKIEGSVPGITVTITDRWANGATDPTLTGITDAIAGIRYTGLIWPENWREDSLFGLGDLAGEMETRFNAENAIMDGTIFTGMTDTFTNIGTDVDGRNSQTVVIMGSELLLKASTPLQDGPSILKPADWVACEFLGIRSRRLTPGAPIANFIISTSGGLDSVGGPALASLPYFNTPLRNTPVTPSPNLFTSTEQAALEVLGFTSYGVNSAQNSMIMGPVVTNWTTDAGGNDNVSFHYLNYVDTGSVCREIFFRVLKATYAQSRLTEGDLIADRSMTNADAIKAELLRIFRFLGTIALTQAGREAASFFASETTVTTSLATGLVTCNGPLPIVTQLRKMNYPLQLSFTVGSTGTQITV